MLEVKSQKLKTLGVLPWLFTVIIDRLYYLIEVGLVLNNGGCQSQ